MGAPVKVKRNYIWKSPFLHQPRHFCDEPRGLIASDRFKVWASGGQTLYACLTKHAMLPFLKNNSSVLQSKIIPYKKISSLSVMTLELFVQPDCRKISFFAMTGSKSITSAILCQTAFDTRRGFAYLNESCCRRTCFGHLIRCINVR